MLTATTTHNGRILAGAHNEYRLIRCVMELSNAETWGEAKGEWGLAGYYHLPVPGPTAECVCGHPIRHVFVVRHEAGHAVLVGSDCIRRFVTPAPDADPFNTLMAIAAAPNFARIGEGVAEVLHGIGWLSTWELGFCRTVARVRCLTNGRRVKQTEINRDVLRRARADANTALEDTQ